MSGWGGLNFNEPSLTTRWSPVGPSRRRSLSTPTIWFLTGHDDDSEFSARTEPSKSFLDAATASDSRRIEQYISSGIQIAEIERQDR